MTITNEEMQHLVSAAAWFLNERAAADEKPTAQATMTLDRANTAFQKLYEGTLSRHPKVDRMALYDVVMHRAKLLHLGCNPNASLVWYQRLYEEVKDDV